MNRGAFTSAEIKKVEDRIGTNYLIDIFSDDLIDTEAQYDALYKKSKGCLMEDNWCLFLTDRKKDKKIVGNLHKLSTFGVEMIAKKFEIDLK